MIDASLEKCQNTAINGNGFMKYFICHLLEKNVLKCDVKKITWMRWGRNRRA
jgi:hypothetical protein